MQRADHHHLSFSAEVTVIGRHLGSVVITVTILCHVSSLQLITQNRHETHRALSFSSCRCPWSWQDTPRTRRVSHHVRRFVSSASTARQKQAEQHAWFSFASPCVVLQAFSSCCGSRSALPKKSLGNSQLHGEQAAASLKSDDIIVLAWILEVLIWCKLVLPLMQTTTFSHLFLLFLSMSFSICCFIFCWSLCFFLC